MAYDTQFRPTTAEVAAFIKNRTVDDTNNYVGDFDDTTIVTAEEVELLIDQCGSSVLSALHWKPGATPPSIPDDNVPTARMLIALFTAIFVEMTKFSEQISRNVSPYPYLKACFDQMLAAKQGELGIISNTGSGGGGLSLVDLYVSQYKGGAYAFPNDPMVGWQTAF